MSERLNAIKTVLSDEEDEIITYLSRKLGIKKSVLVREAIMDWAASKLGKLSALEELSQRSAQGRNRGKSGPVGDHSQLEDILKLALKELRRHG